MLTRQLIRRSYVFCRTNSKEREIALPHPLLSSCLKLSSKELSPSWKELRSTAVSLGEATILSFMILPAKTVTNNHQSQGGHGGS